MLQEKLTSTKTKYVDDADGYSSVKWSYPLALNAGMAFSAYITATAFERFIRKSKHAVSWKHFWNFDGIISFEQYWDITNLLGGQEQSVHDSEQDGFVRFSYATI